MWHSGKNLARVSCDDLAPAVDSHDMRVLRARQRVAEQAV